MAFTEISGVESHLDILPAELLGDPIEARGRLGKRTIVPGRDHDMGPHAGPSPICFQPIELARPKRNGSVERAQAALDASLQGPVQDAVAVDDSGRVEGVRIEVHRPPEDLPGIPPEQLRKAGRYRKERRIGQEQTTVPSHQRDAHHRLDPEPSPVDEPRNGRALPYEPHVYPGRARAREPGLRLDVAALGCE